MQMHFACKHFGGHVLDVVIPQVSVDGIREKHRMRMGRSCGYCMLLLMMMMI